MVAESPYSKSLRLLRLAVAVAGAFALVALLLHAFAPARVVLGETAAVGLEIDKQGPNVIAVEQMITYTIRVTNTSGMALDNVVITDTFNTQVYSGTFETDLSGVTLILVTEPTKYAQFNLGTMDVGDSGYIRFPMVVTPAYQPRHNFGPTTFGNSAVVTTTTPGVQDAFDNADTLIVGPVLRVSKTFTPTNPRPGRLLTYTFLVENLNRSDAITATNIVVTEFIPQNTTFYTAYPPSIWFYDQGTDVVRWSLTETLPVSTSTRVTLTVRLTPTLGYKQVVQNKKERCGVFADDAPDNISCPTDVNTTPDEILEKVTETTIPPMQSGTVSKTFPNRIVTYTVYVYNPFDAPITGLIVTDTFPNKDFHPTQTLQYTGLLSSSPPTLPVVISQSSRSVSWQLPEIEAWGLYTFSFRAHVPPQMPIDDNQLRKEYQNALNGSYGDNIFGGNPGHQDQSMKIEIVPQVLPFKTVTPDEQMYSLPVTYTLTISNAGPTTLTSVAVTDVLPTSFNPGNYCEFQYLDFVSGTPPRFAAGNIVAWDPITLTGYSEVVLATFRATVIGGPGADCYNTVEGYSPDTFFVRWTRLAKVKVLIPFGVTKTVDPTSVVLGNSVTYNAEWVNVGAVNATMYGVTDVLPTGFYFGASPIYTSYFNMPFTLLANRGNSYPRSFPVNVLSTYEPCDNLPKTIYQSPGTVQMRITSPPGLEGIWSNAVNLAPLLVRPQAQVYKRADPIGALPGEALTFTIILSNNTPSAIGNIALTDTLPTGFTFINGTDSPTWSPPYVRWTGLTIPGGSTRLVIFSASAPTNTSTYVNQVKAASATDPLICIPRLNPNLQVPVKRGEIEVNKFATPRVINPLGRFEYRILLKNNGPYTVTINRFTDTLPGVPGHVWKYDGLSFGPAPVGTNPPVWTNLTLGPDKTADLRFFVRADAQVGSYPNTLTQVALGGYITASLPQKWVLTSHQNFTGTPVTVLPGVGLVKEASTDAAFAGDPVVYTITLVNVSGNTINNVRVTDTLPTGFTYESMVSGNSPVSTSPLVWAIPGVANGEANKLVLVFRARISDTQPTGTYYNQVAASADNIFIAPTGDIAPVAVSGLPTLNLGKSVTPASVIAGRDVTYTLTLDNTGDEEVVDARITDTLPSGFSYVQMITGVAPSIVSPQVVWTNITVPSHTLTTLVFRAHVDSGVGDDTYYNRLDGSTAQVVFQSTGQTAPVVVVAAPSFDVRVSKSDGSITGTIGGATTYTIRYTNTVNTLGLLARNVILTETFSPAAYLIPDAPGWNFVASSVYTRLIGDVAAGASGSVTFALQIDAGIPQEYSTITNTVQIGASPQADVPEAVEQPTSNNIFTDIDTIRGSDIVVLGLTVLTPNPRQGQPLTVAVTFMNQGVDPTIGPETTAITGWFGADLYVKPSGDPPPAGPSDRYLGFCATPVNPCAVDDMRWDLYSRIKTFDGIGLASGETYVVTYSYVVPDVGTQWLYVQADPFWAAGSSQWGTSAHGRITETNEVNNIYGPVAINVESGNLYLPLVMKNH